MKLASEFSVPAAPSTVFRLFFDPEVMRGCIPGCEELVRVDDTTYKGRLVNEVAHVRFSAGFSAAIQSVTDEDVKEVVAVLKGEDRKLGSSIKIDAKLTVRPDGDASLIGYEMDMALWGKLGRLGEPIIRRRSREVELEFARSLAIACGAPAESLPAKQEKQAGSMRKLVAGVMGTPANGTGRPAAGTATMLAAGQAGATPAAAGSATKRLDVRRQSTNESGPVAANGTQLAAAQGAGTPAAPDPSLQLAIAATQKLAVIATIISMTAVLVAVFKRGR
jgi:carbon monoxide dehydrogenase subunit G